MAYFDVLRNMAKIMKENGIKWESESHLDLQYVDYWTIPNKMLLNWWILGDFDSSGLQKRVWKETLRPQSRLD